MADRPIAWLGGRLSWPRCEVSQAGDNLGGPIAWLSDWLVARLIARLADALTACLAEHLPNWRATKNIAWLGD